MGRSNRWVYLAPAVEEFRQGLTPDQRERFNELLVRIYCDPTGQTTGAVRHVRPPLVYYAYADELFGVLYMLYKLPSDVRDRVEVFEAGWLF